MSLEVPLEPKRRAWSFHKVLEERQEMERQQRSATWNSAVAKDKAGYGKTFACRSAKQEQHVGLGGILSKDGAASESTCALKTKTGKPKIATIRTVQSKATEPVEPLKSAEISVQWQPEPKGILERKESTASRIRDRIYSEPPDSPSWQEKKRKFRLTLADYSLDSGSSLDTDFEPKLVVDNIRNNRQMASRAPVEPRPRCYTDPKIDERVQNKKSWVGSLRKLASHVPVRIQTTGVSMKLDPTATVPQGRRKSSMGFLSCISGVIPSPLTPTDPKLGLLHTVLIVGAENTGKTTLIRYLEKCLANKPANAENPPIGFSFVEVNSGKDDLWQSLSASGALFLFAADDSKSLKVSIECLSQWRGNRRTRCKFAILICTTWDAKKRKKCIINDGKAVSKQYRSPFVELPLRDIKHVEILQDMISSFLVSASESAEGNDYASAVVDSGEEGSCPNDQDKSNSRHCKTGRQLFKENGPCYQLGGCICSSGRQSVSSGVLAV